MKLLITTLFASMLWLSSANLSENTLTIQVNGIKNSNGYLIVVLHNGSSDFPDGEPFKMAEVYAERGSVEVVFENLPAGEYAVAIAHDENANQEFDMDSNGMPLEGWGFSNNPLPMGGPSSWSETAFDLGGDHELEINMVYLNR